MLSRDCRSPGTWRAPAPDTSAPPPATRALFQPMKPLKAAATTSQPVLTSQQIETIFFKVPELYEIHKDFYDGLLPRVQQWGHQQRVGDLFQKLVRDAGASREWRAGEARLLPEPDAHPLPGRPRSPGPL